MSTDQLSPQEWNSIARGLRDEAEGLAMEAREAQTFLSILRVLRQEQLIELPEYAVTLLDAYEKAEITDKFDVLIRRLDQLVTLFFQVQDACLEGDAFEQGGVSPPR